MTPPGSSSLENQTNNLHISEKNNAAGNAQVQPPVIDPNLGSAASKFNPANKKDLKTMAEEKLEKVKEALSAAMLLEESDAQVLALVKRQAMFVKLLGTLKQKEIIESSSNDSAGKQLEVIPLDAYPPFNPLDWKSEVVADVAKASVKISTIPCTSFDNFASRFEDVLTQYGRNVQADWFLCLKDVFSISKHARWFDRCIAAGVDGKNHSWKKAKLTMKSSFDVSIKSPLSWVESLKGLRQDDNERLLSFADRFLTALMGATVVPSEQNKLICMLFVVSLMPKYRELVSDGFKQAYMKKHDSMDVDGDSAEATFFYPTTFSELQDFCVSASDDIEVAIQEFKNENSKKRASSAVVDDIGKSSKKSYSGKRMRNLNNSSSSVQKVEKPGKTFPSRKCRFCPFFPFSLNHMRSCPGRPKANEDKPGNMDKKVDFASTGATNSFEQPAEAAVDHPVEAFAHELEFYVSNFESPYASDLDDESDDSGSAPEGKMDKICLTVKRSSYTIGDNDNPFKTTDPSFSPITPIILQDIEVTGLLDSGSEISLLNKEFADKHHISCETIDGNLVFLDGTKVPRMRTTGVVNLLYDEVDKVTTHQFDVITNSIAFGSNQILIGRDLIPKLGTVPFINVAHKYKNKMVSNLQWNSFPLFSLGEIWSSLQLKALSRLVAPTSKLQWVLDNFTPEGDYRTGEFIELWI